jgi:DNA-binding protein YbaB
VLLLLHHRRRVRFVMIGRDNQTPIELRRLHAEAARFTKQMAAPEILHSAHTAKDATGAVTASTGPDGRVADVKVDPDWSRRLTVDQLGSAVVEAVNDAALRRLAAWAETTDAPMDAMPGHSADTGRRPGEPAPLHLPQIPPPGPLGDLSSATVEANVGELFELMADARGAMDAIGRRLEDWATTRNRGHSPGREVTVTLQGNQPVEVEFSPVWIRHADAGEITRALRKAFAVAYQAHRPLTLDDLAVDSPLAALRDLTADPLALLRRVGLRLDTQIDEGERRATT